MPKIDKTNWFEHVKDPNDYAEYMTMFEKYDPRNTILELISFFD